MSAQSLPSIDNEFSAAVHAWNGGHLDEAQRRCTTVLRRKPTHVDALRLSGMLAYQRGDYSAAATFYLQALKQQRDPQTLNALAIAYDKLGDKIAVNRYFSQCLKEFPRFSEAIVNWALIQQAHGQTTEAISLFERALVTSPSDKRMLANLVILYNNAGRTQDADRCFSSLQHIIESQTNELENAGLFLLQANALQYSARLLYRLIELDPQKAPLLHELGAQALRTRSLDIAVSAFNRCLEHSPRDALAMNNLALACMHQKKIEDAIKLLKSAIEIDPSFSDGMSNLSSILSDTHQNDEAEFYARRALEINKNNINAMINLGKILSLKKELEEAETLLKRALALEPENYLANANLGNVYNRQGRFQESIDAYRHSLDIAMKNKLGRDQVADSLFNIGLSYGRLGEFDASIKHYAESAQLDDSNKDCIFNLGIGELTRGDFTNAWPHYFYRPRYLHPNVVLTPISPGMDLTGKNILIVAGQGLGDEILFMRFAAQLRAQCAQTTYLADLKIAGILQGVAGIDRVITETLGTQDYDFVFSLDDLPLLLNIDRAELIPPPIQLSTDDARVQRAKQHLASVGAPPYVGITWRAGLTESKRGPGFQALYKDIAFDGILTVLNQFRCTIVDVQRNATPEERAKLDAMSLNPVLHANEFNDELSDMLALLLLMDEYIAVSNTNVHLRAAVNKVTRVLVPYPPEWRWLDHGRHSPWYKALPVYRQQPNNDWQAAIDTLNADLALSLPLRNA